MSQERRNIAREAKRDSSAMKATAVLTMFFLPSTCFAASIAMPLSQLELNLYCDGQILGLLGCDHPSYDSGTCGVDTLACV
ncbi:uncharacterized protein K444DRAFT_222164 [Hyaloscypha bicolor E]|uniref:Uncharacterized protein n=1 Tax=Hyaloscypha bicolor E TaxID=1095630 RepID=A0A2J6SJN0_9HELO|nr:uncharacterized protein K444DRAFT_222164 [Hyaloscypha bicolor E]PMD50966.1 hypothetical protein K444DRAFT_222164 [Hyaloscypha bicolor E]